MIDRWYRASSSAVKPIQNGLLNDIRKARAFFLYPAEHFFWTYFAVDEEKQDEMIQWYVEHHGTFFPCECIVPEDEWGAGFDGRTQTAEMHRGFNKIINAGLSPWVSLISNRYAKDILGCRPRDNAEGFNAYGKAILEIAPLVIGRTGMVMSSIEIDELFTQDAYRVWIVDTLRSLFGPKMPIGIHCLPGEAPYRVEILGKGPTVALLQWSFKKVATGNDQDGWTITPYAKEIVASTKHRLQPNGDLTCLIAACEHSIPLVMENQPWTPWRSLSGCYDISVQLGDEGCNIDLNGGAML